MSGSTPASPAPPPTSSGAPGATSTSDVGAAGGSRREAAKAEAPAPTPGRGRTVLKVVVGLVLAVVWIRFVLFAWVFPIVERRFDSPEIGPAEAESVESLAELPSLTAWATTGA